ncbi:amidohydrolase [Myxococcota bacterium]|nr:amidohydrolase [Myxococcota bacterium]
MYRGHRYIDSDAHVLEPSNLWERYLDPRFKEFMPRHSVGYEGDGPSWYLEIDVCGHQMPNFGPTREMAATLPGLKEAYQEYNERGFGPDAYPRVLERSGIDHMVVYPTVGLYVTGVPDLSASVAAAYRRAYNDWLFDFCSEAGSGIIGAGAVDLRDPEEAAREVRRCVDNLGFKAITINPEPINEIPLHDPFYDPIWRECQALGVPVGVHVAAGTDHQQVGLDYFPDWWIGRPVTAFTVGCMLACLSFIAGGVCERHPELRVVFLESGAGWVPFWLDRMAAGIAGHARKFGLPGLSMHPKEYWNRQCFISADPDDPGIEEVARQIGSESIVTATDFGHVEGMGYVHALDDILGLPNVSDAVKREIMWDNPARLYGISD